MKEVHCDVRTEEAYSQNNRAYSKGVGENSNWHAGEENCKFLDGLRIIGEDSQIFLREEVLQRRGIRWEKHRFHFVRAQVEQQTDCHGDKREGGDEIHAVEIPGYKEQQAESENQTGSFELTRFRIHFFPAEPSDKSGNSRD